MPWDDISGREGDVRMTPASSLFFFFERVPNPSTMVDRCTLNKKRRGLVTVYAEQNALGMSDPNGGVNALAVAVDVVWEDERSGTRELPTRLKKITQ